MNKKRSLRIRRVRPWEISILMLLQWTASFAKETQFPLAFFIRLQFIVEMINRSRWPHLTLFQ